MKSLLSAVALVSIPTIAEGCVSANIDKQHTPLVTGNSVPVLFSNLYVPHQRPAPVITPHPSINNNALPSRAGP